MLEVISLLGVVKNHLPHPKPGPFGLLATLQLSCQTAPETSSRKTKKYAFALLISFKHILHAGQVMIRPPRGNNTTSYFIIA